MNYLVSIVICHDFGAGKDTFAVLRSVRLDFLGSRFRTYFGFNTLAQIPSIRHLYTLYTLPPEESLNQREY